MTAVVFQFSAQGMQEIIAGVNQIAKATEQAAAKSAKVRTQTETAEKASAIKSINIAKAKEEARWREVEKAAGKIETQLKRETAAAEREAAKRVKIEERAQNKIAAEREKAAMAGLKGGAKAIGGFAVAASAAVMGIVGAAVRDNLKVSELANRVSVNARQAGETAVDPRTLQREFEATAKATPGVKSEDIAKGVLNYVNLTGDLGTARKMQGTFATVAQATGSDMSDVTTTAANMSQKFDIKGVEEMQQAFATLMQQGKQGAMTIDQVAGQFARLSAAGQRFGFHGAQGVAQLGGLANMARTSTGSSEQASTAVEQMLGHIIQNAVKLKGQGVSVFDKQGQTRNINDILVDTVQKVGGKNMGLKKIKLQELMGEEGVRALSPMMSKYNDVFTSTKGTDGEKVAAATSALKDMIEKATSTTETWSGVQTDAAQIQQSASAQLTAAWEHVVAETGNTLVPALVSLVPKFLSLVPAIDPVIGTLGMLAGALGDLFKFLGLVHKETDQDRQKQAHMALDAFDAKHANEMGPLPLDVQAERDRLAKTASDADEAIIPTADKGALSNLNKVLPTLTEAEFAKKFAEAGPEGSDTNSDTYLHNIGAGHDEFKRIQANPEEDHTSMGMTDKQNKLVSDMTSQAINDAAQQRAAVAKMVAQWDAATLAANRASKALDKLGGAAGRAKPNSDR